MRSQITANEASALVEKYEQDYVDICAEIRKAATGGENEITVDHIDQFEIRQQLEKDGFDLTTIQKNSEEHFTRIWWK